MSFTAAELRLLKYGDRAVSTRAATSRSRRGRVSTGSLGTLTREQALEMHNAGASRPEMARAAGVAISRVGTWRRAQGLVRDYTRRSLSTGGSLE